MHVAYISSHNNYSNYKLSNYIYLVRDLCTMSGKEFATSSFLQECVAHCVFDWRLLGRFRCPISSELVVSCKETAFFNIVTLPNPCILLRNCE